MPHKKSGFSLIEIFIVLAIISILVVAGVGNYKPYVARAKRAEAELMLRKLSSAMEAFYLTHGSFKGVSLHTLGFLESAGGYRLRIKEIIGDEYVLIAEGKDGDLMLTSRGASN